MPRSRSSGRPAARSAPRPAMRQAPPPAPVHHAPPPAMQQNSGGGSMLGGLASTIAQGMAFGTGSAVAHRAVDSMMGPRTVEHVEVSQTTSSQGPMSSPVASSSGSMEACVNQTKAFQDCVMANSNDIGKCQFYVDMLNECRRGSSQSSFL